MIHDPSILILDEPTTGLDPNQIVEIRELIRHLGREKTVIFSTHILPEVEATCDRIIIINEGQIVADGAPEALRKQASGNEVYKVKIEDGSKDAIYDALKTLPTVHLVDPLPNSDLFLVESLAEQSSKRGIFQLCVQNNWILTEMTPIEHNLEDIFRDVTLG